MSTKTQGPEEELWRISRLRSSLRRLSHPLFLDSCQLRPGAGLSGQPLSSQEFHGFLSCFCQKPTAPSYCLDELLKYARPLPLRDVMFQIYMRPSISRTETGITS